MRRAVALIVLSIAAAFPNFARAQRTVGDRAGDPAGAPEYLMLLRREGEAEAELKRLRAVLKARDPRIAFRQRELRIIGRGLSEMRARAVTGSGRGRAYGPALLRRVELEIELEELSAVLKPQHPDVKLKKAELAAVGRRLAEMK